MSTEPLVVLEERPMSDGRVLAVAMLNSERALHALSVDMIAILLPAMRRWATDARVAAVFLHASGEKAFCAGGDVRRVCLSVRENGIDDAYAQQFFSAEYELDYLIHQFPKPVVVWGNGIVMGGGIGLLCGASHRIVTEQSRLAMPEITIGLYPDVGGSYFLSRVKGRLGLFVGMTGVSMNAADALHIGLADMALAASARDQVLSALSALSLSAEKSIGVLQISKCLAKMPQAQLAASELAAREAVLNVRAGSDDLLTLYTDLTASSDDAWLERTAATLRKGSPTSAALIFRQWQRGRAMTLADVFREELVLSVQCARHPDFIEGVRALLVDKDNSPAWYPATLAAVTPAWLDEHYQPPWSGVHPLAALESSIPR